MLQDVCLQEHCGRRECAGRSQRPKTQRSSLHRGTLGLQAAKRETGSLSLQTLSLGPRNAPNSPKVLLNFLVSTFPLLRHQQPSELNRRGPGRRPFPRETHRASK